MRAGRWQLRSRSTLQATRRTSAFPPSQVGAREGSGQRDLDQTGLLTGALWLLEGTDLPRRMSWGNIILPALHTEELSRVRAVVLSSS